MIDFNIGKCCKYELRFELQRQKSFFNQCNIKYLNIQGKVSEK